MPVGVVSAASAGGRVKILDFVLAKLRRPRRPVREHGHRQPDTKVRRRVASKSISHRVRATLRVEHIRRKRIRGEIGRPL